MWDQGLCLKTWRNMQHMVDSKHFWKNEWKIAHLAPDGSLQWYTGVIDLQVYSNLITIWLQNEFWEIYSIQLKKRKKCLKI